VTAIAATVQMFFTERLIRERGASPATITAYRDTIRLLLNHAATATRTPVAALDFTQLDTQMISGFLHHLESGRGTASAPATPAWPRSGPCSPTPPAGTPSTPATSPGSWRSAPNAPPAPPSLTSPIPSSPP